MQVRDEAAWAAQLIEFEADDVSRKFKDFLIQWTNNLDNVINVEDWYGPQFSFATCVSKALKVTEQTMGFLSIEWISQMLLVMCDHWVNGQQLYDGLSHIEQRLVDQATAMKLVELQASAASE